MQNTLVSSVVRILRKPGLGINKKYSPFVSIIVLLLVSGINISNITVDFSPSTLLPKEGNDGILCVLSSLFTDNYYDILSILLLTDCEIYPRNFLSMHNTSDVKNDNDWKKLKYAPLGIIFTLRQDVMNYNIAYSISSQTEPRLLRVRCKFYSF